jgi:maltose alpha-D-glucosyltransferase/alpha-amylase
MAAATSESTGTTTAQAADSRLPGSAGDPLWYKDAVIYELHVRTFADSNGDGIGDFRGLIGKLEYLQQLGVTCLWLLPFYPSPLRDDGYDIANYTDVHPSYGTLADFREFLDEAHARGMQVLIELVMNHTSDQHPWFQRARLAAPGTPEREFYVWNQSDDRFPLVPIIFSDTEKSNWAWDETAGAFYWHRFFSHQPDLNFDNPLVIEEMLKAMRFWLGLGVDALRMDAIPYLIERDGTRCESLPETHAIIKKFRATMDAEFSNRFILAEANQWPADVRPYFADGDECQMAFHFPLMPRIYVSLRQEDTQPIIDIMALTPAIPDVCQWGLFLRNHDELTLEMVTDDERDYMYLAYSQDPRMRVNVGIRRRLAPLLDNNRARIELLSSLLFSFPGTPILYYGDEIGMGDNIDLGDRNGVRTPMQWNRDANGGFSVAAPPQMQHNPTIDDPVYGYQAVNVAEQRANSSSLWAWTRNMIGLRKLFPVFGRGTFRMLPSSSRKVLTYLREYEGQTVLCVANIARSAQPVQLDLSEFAGRTPVEMQGYTPFPQIGAQPYVLTLSPYAFLWFELQSPELAATLESQPTATNSIVDDDPNDPTTLTLSEALTPPRLLNDGLLYPLTRALYGRGERSHLTGDVATLFFRIVGAAFNDIESRSRSWQRLWPASKPDVVSQDRSTAHTTLQFGPILNAFRDAPAAHRAVWSQVLTPQTLLAVQRLARSQAAEFNMPDTVWVRVVYDFLAAWRARTVRHDDLLAALESIYMGWAASHLIANHTASLKDPSTAPDPCPEDCAERLTTLAKTFERDKPYLVARWRWPDPFNP